MVFSTLSYSVSIKMGLPRGQLMLLFILLAQWVPKVTSQDLGPDLGIVGCPLLPVRLAVPRRTDTVLGTWTEATTTNSDVVLIDRSHIPGNATFPVGFTDVEYTFRNTATGDEDTCSFRFYVFWTGDNQPPQIQNCPQDITRITQSSVTTVSVSWIIPTATDNAGPARLQSRTHDPPFDFPFGTTPVMYTFEDTRGLVATCEFNVNIREQDIEPPVIACPGDQFEQVPVGETQATVRWPAVTATDNAGTSTLINMEPPTLFGLTGGIFSIGTSIVSYVYSDSVGNLATCVFNVDVEAVPDPHPPVVSCQEDGPPVFTVASGDNGQAFWPVPMVIFDDSMPVQTLSNYDPGDFFPIGTTRVEYSFIDRVGNEARCAFNVIVQDTTPPVFNNCPQRDITATILIGQVTVAVSWETITAVDNSGLPPSVSGTRQSGSQFPQGSTMVNVTAVDGSSNQAICTFNVIVTPVPPTMPIVIRDCPTNITMVAPSDQPGAFVRWTEPTADAVLSVLTRERSHIPPAFFPIGRTEVVYTFTDLAGNFALCTFDVIVEDLTPPDISNCPSSPIRVSLTQPQATTIVTFTPPIATDNSQGVVTVDCTHNSGNVFPEGTTLVICVFTDESDNSNICMFQVIVEGSDPEDPVITNCPADITRQGGPGLVLVMWPPLIVTDNSGIPPTRLLGPPNFQDLFAPGTTEVVTYIYSDAANNIDECMFTVTIVPPTAPMVDCSGLDIIVTAPFNQPCVAVELPSCSATSNVGIVIQVSQLPPSRSCFSIGTTTVTNIFRDSNGLQGSGNFTVTVNPGVAITCPNDGVGIRQAETGVVIGVWSDPGCIGGVSPLSSSCTPPSGSVIGIGDTQVVCTCTDSRGISDGCGFTVLEIPPPIVDCSGEDIIITAPAGASGVTVTTLSRCRAVDNSGRVEFVTQNPSPGSFFPIGDTTVTVVYRDPSGNTGVGSYTVTVRSDVAITCPVDGASVPQGGSGDVIGVWSDPVCIGGVPPLSTSCTPPMGSVIGTGDTQVVCTCTDSRGTSGGCGFTVSALIPPLNMACPNIQSLSAIRFATFIWSGPACTGGVGPLSTSCSPPSGSTFDIGTSIVTCVCTDTSGMSDTCTFPVTVVDTEDPIVDCSGEDVTTNAQAGAPGVTLPTLSRCRATDNSGQVIFVSQNPSPGSFFPIGDTTVTVVYRDPSGNTGVGSYIVTVRSDVAITCPVDGASVPQGGSGDDIGVWSDPVCIGGVPPLSTSCTPPLGSVIGTGDTQVVCTCTDSRGTSDGCGFTVSVHMRIMMSCPPDVPSVLLGNSDTAISVWSDPTCTGGREPLNIRCDRQSGNAIPLGVTTVTCTCTDSRGEEDTCSFRIVRPDLEPPEVDCSGLDIVRFASFGTSCVLITLPTCRATDNSGTLTPLPQSPSSPFCFPVGTTTVSNTFQDPSGNEGTGNFTVTVIQDDEPPVVNCAGLSTTVSAALGQSCVRVTFQSCTATDNQGRVTLVSQSHQSGFCFPEGVTEVIFRFRDDAGNIGMDSFTVTVIRANPCNNSLCLNGGVCIAVTLTDSTCVCTGCFTGPSCQISARPCGLNRCENGGTCQPLQGSCQASFCNCPPCYTGLTCQTRVDACRNHECQNGAVCIPRSSDCDQYTCQCPSCFMGDFCQIAIPDPCDSSPCLNGGQCSRVPNSCYDLSCTCSIGFSGERCEQVVNVLDNPCNNFPCLNQGSCISFGSTYKCICRPGFLGTNCQQTVGDALSFEGCSPNSPCQNGGTCFESYTSTSGLNPRFSQYICICNNGFTGERCAIPVNQAPQLNSCLGINICQNGGTCRNSYCSFQDRIDFFCECPIGFIGEVCSIPYGNPCSTRPCGDGGVCQPFNQYFVCSCLPGYSGITCDQIPTDACNPNPCQNGGNCRIINGRFSCICPSGFTGQTCGQATDACNPNPCQNGGNCRIINGRFSCICPSGFTGQTCGQGFGGVDVTPPDISNCPGDTTISFPPGINFVEVSWTAPTAEDESPPIQQEQNRISPAFLQRGQTLNVIYEFTDRLGNTATCSFFFFSNV